MTSQQPVGPQESDEVVHEIAKVGSGLRRALYETRGLGRPVRRPRGRRAAPRTPAARDDQQPRVDRNNRRAVEKEHPAATLAARWAIAQHIAQQANQRLREAERAADESQGRAAQASAVEAGAEADMQSGLDDLAALRADVDNARSHVDAWRDRAEEEGYDVRGVDTLGDQDIHEYAAAVAGAWVHGDELETEQSIARILTDDYATEWAEMVAAQGVGSGSLPLPSAQDLIDDAAPDGVALPPAAPAAETRPAVTPSAAATATLDAAADPSVPLDVETTDDVEATDYTDTYDFGGNDAPVQQWDFPSPTTDRGVDL